MKQDKPKIILYIWNSKDEATYNLLLVLKKLEMLQEFEEDAMYTYYEEYRGVDEHDNEIYEYAESHEGYVVSWKGLVV